MRCISVGSNDFRYMANERFFARNVVRAVDVVSFFFFHHFVPVHFRWSKRINCCSILDAHARVLDYNEKESIIFVVVAVVGGGAIDGTVDIIRWGWITYYPSITWIFLAQPIITSMYRISMIWYVAHEQQQWTSSQSMKKKTQREREREKIPNPNISA